MMLPPTANSIMAAIQTQSDSSSASPALRAAASAHRSWFVASVLWVLFAGLVAAFLSWLSWKAGNREQQVAASEANERVTKLGIELGNTNTKLEEERQKTDKQREKAAVAEKSLLELQSLLKEQRTIDRNKGDKILNLGAKGSVKITFVSIGTETSNLAHQLSGILVEHGWTITAIEPALFAGGGPGSGIVITIHGDVKNPTVVTNWGDIPEPAKTLHRLLAEAIIGNPAVETRVMEAQPEELIWVVIGLKY